MISKIARLEIQLEAKARCRRHESHPTHRPLSKDYEYIGLLGEKALAEFSGASLDLVPRPNGDGGKDALLHTICGDFPADVKAARKAFYLIVERGKVRPLTIYLLGQLEHENTDEPSVRLVGWEWAERVLRAPVRDFGCGVMNHHIPRTSLRKMHELSGVLR
jgi:hypothetical protein